MHEHERYAQLMQAPNAIFVFGSNLAGRHGKGAAKTAREQYGAEYGVGEGGVGRTYAIPTKDRDLNVLSLETIRTFVTRFVLYARHHPGNQFIVTRVGCGLAGYKDEEIAPLFKGASSNVVLPEGWSELIASHGAQVAPTARATIEQVLDAYRDGIRTHGPQAYLEEQVEWWHRSATRARLVEQFGLDTVRTVEHASWDELRWLERDDDIPFG